MMHCATFAKSPNCASHSTSESLRRDAVAVLEGEHRDFGERRVVDLERRRVFREMLQRRVRLAALVVVQHRLPMRERAALGVLPADAHRRATHEQRRPRERLGVSPIDATLGGERRAPALEHARELGQRMKV